MKLPAELYESRTIGSARQGMLARLLERLIGGQERLCAGPVLSRSKSDMVLSFPLTEVLVLAEHARRCYHHRACASQFHDRRLWRDPKTQLSVEQIESLGGEHIDPRKVPAALELVRDDGIYLMSNGLPVQRDPRGTACRVVYAKGFDPHQNPHWDYHARKSLGLDHFSLPVPLRWIRSAHMKGKHQLLIELTPQGMKAL